MLSFFGSSPVAVELKQRDSIIVKVIYHLALPISHLTSETKEARINNFEIRISKCFRLTALCAMRAFQIAFEITRCVGLLRLLEQLPG
jgi:hypothetical protein